MNIILINHYAGSHEHGMEFRPFYLARHWVRQGHHVSIVASSSSHVRKKSPKITGQVTKEIIEGINYNWIKTYPYKGNSLGRIINMFSFIVKLFIFYRKYIDQVPDIVIASSTYPLDIFPSWFLSKKYGAKLVFEVHDLWPLSPMELGGYSKWHPFILVMQLAENFACKKTDTMVSLLPEVKEHFVAHGLDLSKFHHIPNGIEIEEWDNSVELPNNIALLFKELRSKNAFIIGYSGAHGIANSLNTPIEAAKELRSRHVHFVFVGNGPEKNNLKKLSDSYQLDNVHFLDAIDKKYIPSFLKSCDALYIGLKKCSLFRFGISPNKLLDYMMSAKPIIHAIEAGNDYVQEAQCGFSVEAENPKKVVDGIEQLLSNDSNQLNIMGKNGRKYLEENFKYTKLADKFLNAVQG